MTNKGNFLPNTQNLTETGAEEQLLSIQTVGNPDKDTILVDHIARGVFSNKPYKKTFSEKSYTARATQEVKKVEYALDVFVNEEIENIPHLNELDKHTYNAIATAVYHTEPDKNGYIIPLSQIGRIMNQDFKRKITKNQLDEIHESISKMSSIRLTMDFSAEKELFPPNIKNLTIQENLLSNRYIKAMVNGKETRCLQLLKKPCLLEYCENKDYRIAFTPMKILHTPSISNTKDNRLIKNELKEKINLMKRKSSLSRSIPYEYFYNLLNINTTSTSHRKKKFKTRESIKEILKNWISNGFIKDFKEDDGKGKSTALYGIIIVLEEEK